jgi:hypothetical protein
MFSILLLIFIFNSWVQICASHVEKGVDSFFKSLGGRIIQSKVDSCPLWINSFVIDMMEM